MKTLVHTDKELIEATIKKCDICYWDWPIRMGLPMYCR